MKKTAQSEGNNQHTGKRNPAAPRINETNLWVGGYNVQREEGSREDRALTSTDYCNLSVLNAAAGYK
jgi:hypothetical protein